MNIPKKEVEHQIKVLKETKSALSQSNSIKLKELSNQTIHCAVTFQNEASLQVSILIYTLSKLIERSENKKIKNWNSLEKKIISNIDLSISALEQKNEDKYLEYLKKIRYLIINNSSSSKEYISDLIRKSCINRAAKLHEHGLSIGKTAQLCQINPWELSQYASSSHSSKIPKPKINTKTRAKLALDFFSS